MKKQLVRDAMTVVMMLILNSQLNHAQIILVPQDYATIQAGINAAADGDTVIVDTGRYFENINFNAKNILLTSKFLYDHDTSFISQTIIDGSQPENPDSATCVYFGSGESNDAILQGFTITGGTGTKMLSVSDPPFSFREGGAISIEESSPTIQFNLIKGNYVTNEEDIDRIAGGGAIRGRYCDAIIQNNVIIDNEGFHNGGISFYWSSGTIRNNIIANNLLSKEFGGAALLIENNLGATIIENNTMVANTTTQTGPTGGIYLYNGDIEARNNILWGNTQQSRSEVAGNGTFEMEYNNIQIPRNNPGDLTQFPEFNDSAFMLLPESPAIDAGDTAVIFNDIESEMPGQALFPSLGTLRNDMGAYGGPHAAVLPYFEFTGIYVQASVNFGNTYLDSLKPRTLIIRNLSTHHISVDSVQSEMDDVNIDFTEAGSLMPVDEVEVTLSWQPGQIGELEGELDVYHNIVSLENPLKVQVSGNAIELPDALDEVYDPQQGSKLLPCFPNPVKTTATIPVILKEWEQTRVLISDISGKLVTTLADNYLSPGRYNFELDTSSLAPGMYYCSLIISSGVQTQRINVLK